MRLRKRLLIIPDTVPETDEDICFAVAEHCAEQQLTYEFLSRAHPVIVLVDGHKYEITKRLAPSYCTTVWILRGKEID